MKQLTAQQQRKYVDARWENFRVEKSTLCRPTVRVDTNPYRHFHGKNEAEAVHAAFLFTKERERQIAEVQREIRFIDSFSCVANCLEDEEDRQRILAREQAALAELKRGMK